MIEESNLTTAQTNVSEPYLSTKKKNTAFLLSFFLGLFGVDRFYLGRYVTGVLKILCCFCGIWWLIDLIRIGVGNLRPKHGEYAGKVKTGTKVLISFILIAAIVAIILQNV